MGPTHITSIISIIFGLLLFLISVWFLITIDIHGNKYTKDSDYAQWVAERRIRLQWGAAASFGISVGIFQFIFSIGYVIANFKDQKGTHTWNLAAMILHLIFLLCMFYSLALGIDGLSKAGGGPHIAFLVLEAIEGIFLTVYTIVFERQCGYFATVAKLFTCEEVKSKLAEFSLVSFPFPLRSSNIRMERLIEEDRPVPV